ncbi:hypothetical protein ONE63_005031 [Megalurothrips usitatus]|uniref:pectin lyase n=1 Tax=Megalurothrips usitatus TaxID=439358 RepID=A0AAV7X1K4_9NEOP|nr:hypothetical protein ONE63_005031 [Megalurothrips usitatus]
MAALTTVLMAVALQALLAQAWKQDCITKPVGFGRLTTGGAGGKTVQPKSVDELKTLLSSKDKLIIDLTTTFDFTSTEGTTTATGCVFNSCGSGEQLSLPLYGACSGKPVKKVQYAKAGARTEELIVSSHKTIMSSNGKGVIKGKGIRIDNAENVIVRDITISDINPGVIWAGDAVVLNKVTNVWIHKCTFRNIGRQHLVTYVQQNKGITVSSCLFDGNTQHSLFCNGAHYWMWLFWGTRDEITLINNRVVNAAGRLPHAGGQKAEYRNLVHMVGNEMDTNTHQGIQAMTGGYVLAEGNKWTKYYEVIDSKNKGGYVALINTAADAASCSAPFGQKCLINAYVDTKAPTRVDHAVFNEFAKLDKEAINGARAAACEL